MARDGTGTGGEDGLDGAFVRELVRHRRERFDWPAAERALNRLPQVRVRAAWILDKWRDWTDCDG